MTDIVQAHGTKARRRFVMPLAAIVVLSAGVGIGVAIARRGKDTATSTVADASMVRATDVNRACSDWMAATTVSQVGADRWCTDMTAWMDQQISSGHMMGPMMWGDPDRMRDTCRAWMAADATDIPAAWCDDMVTWMRQHADNDWNNWMKNGQMMGR